MDPTGGVEVGGSKVRVSLSTPGTPPVVAGTLVQNNSNLSGPKSLNHSVLIDHDASQV